MQSNPSQTFFYKYGILLIGGLFASVLVINFLTGKGFTRDGVSYEMTLADLASWLIFPLMLIMLEIYLKDRVVAIKLGSQSITVSPGEDEEKVRREEDRSIKRLWFVQPPLYVLRVRNEGGFYLFPSAGFSINFFGYVWDLSDMAEFIKRKKKEYGFD